LESNERRDGFLAKAKEAEEQAEKATGETNKASWLRIAAAYHDLAAHELDEKS
jgi:HD superfamily phosphohydrolase YqeK